MKTKPKLNQVDVEALTRAIELYRNLKEPGRAEQVAHLLKTESWFSVADHCACGLQRRSLKIKMWQSPPAEIDPGAIETIIARGDDNLGGDYAAAKLLRRMLKAGLSRYEPDPIRALAEAKARQQVSTEPAPTAA
jgi:hypothetical protein